MPQRSDPDDPTPTWQPIASISMINGALDDDNWRG